MSCVIFGAIGTIGTRSVWPRLDPLGSDKLYRGMKQALKRYKYKQRKCSKEYIEKSLLLFIF